MTETKEIYEILLNRNFQEILFGELEKFSKSGNEYTACCPFHDDKNPSFSISKDKPLWFCHSGCGGGDWINYLERRNGYSFIDAFKYLANAAGIDVGEDEILEEKNRHYSLFEIAQEYFVKSLFSEDGTETLEYLQNRGYTEAQIRTMELGCYTSYDKTLSRLNSKGYSRNDINTAFKWLNFDGKLYREEYKVTIPYRDEIGRIKAFIGRLIRPLRDNEKEFDKYKPLTDAEGVKLSPFNIQRAKKFKDIIIVEGYFDALILSANGIENAIALAGTNMPKSYFDIFKKYGVRRLFFALDADKAGEEATKKILNNGDYELFKYYVAHFPEDAKDPDELIKKHGITEFLHIIKSSQSAAVWMTDSLTRNRDLSLETEIDESLEEILDFTKKQNDPIEIGKIVNETAFLLGIKSETIESRINSISKKEKIEKEILTYKRLNRILSKQIDDENIDQIRESIAEAQIESSKYKHIESITPYSIDNLKRDLQNKSEGLKTGYESLDEIITIPNGAITLIAGRPSHGKTTFLLNMIINMVREYPKKAFLFFSYEEDKAALSVKSINILSECVINEKSANKNNEQIEYYIRGGNTMIPSINNGMSEFEKYVNERRLWFIDAPLDVDALCDLIEFQKEKYEIGGIFVDYIQRVKYEGKTQDERVKIARISEKFREASVQQKIPYIIGAQLNRESRGRPRIEYLKEAGNLEEDANLVLGIFNLRTATVKEMNDEKKNIFNIRGKPANLEDRHVDLEAHILKNRSGRINESVLLKFDPPVLKIKDEY